MIACLAAGIGAAALLWISSTENVPPADGPLMAAGSSYYIEASGVGFDSIEGALKDALLTDTIVVSRDGLIPTPPLVISQPTRIRAEPGVTPIFVPEDPANGLLIDASAPLAIEGVAFRHVARAWEEATSIFKASDNLFLSNCRIERVIKGEIDEDNPRPAYFSASGEKLRLINCELYAPFSALFSYARQNGAEVVLKNNAIVHSEGLIAYSKYPDESTRIQLVNNSFLGQRALVVWVKHKIPVELTASGCVFGSRDLLGVFPESGTSLEECLTAISWKGDRNLYGSHRFLTLIHETDEEDTVVAGDFASWRAKLSGPR